MSTDYLITKPGLVAMLCSLWIAASLFGMAWAEIRYWLRQRRQMRGAGGGPAEV